MNDTQRREGFRREIFTYAHKRGKHGVTTDELAVHFVTVPNCISGRMTEMKQLGWIISANKTRMTRRNRPAEVWRTNPDFSWLLKAWALKLKHATAKEA
jgi:hypothetical protein